MSVINEIDSAAVPVRMHLETLVMRPEGSSVRQEYLAIEVPYKIALNDRVIGSP
jgi:hypothetical protein